MLIGFLLSTLSFMPSRTFVPHNSNKLHWLFPSISYLPVRVLIWFLIVSATDLNTFQTCCCWLICALPSIDGAFWSSGTRWFSVRGFSCGLITQKPRPRVLESSWVTADSLALPTCSASSLLVLQLEMGSQSFVLFRKTKPSGKKKIWNKY